MTGHAQAVSITPPRRAVFCTSFSGGNAVIVILTATALFWLPELAGVLLAGLVLLQRKIADTFLV